VSHCPCCGAPIVLARRAGRLLAYEPHGGGDVMITDGVAETYDPELHLGLSELFVDHNEET
jgi:hypothetical protein